MMQKKIHHKLKTLVRKTSLRAVEFCHQDMLDYSIVSPTSGSFMSNEKFQPTATIMKFLHVAYLREPVGV
jgi:hypothetical protein